MWDSVISRYCQFLNFVPHTIIENSINYHFSENSFFQVEYNDSLTDIFQKDTYTSIFATRAYLYDKWYKHNVGKYNNCIKY